jgi:hypothetical protein
MEPSATDAGMGRRFPSILEPLLDFTLTFALLAAVLRSLVPRRFVVASGLPGPLAELAPVVLIALLLLALRVAVAMWRDVPAGLRPGRWFAGLRVPALVLAAACGLLVAARPPTASPMGADEQAYLRQLHGIVFEGRLGEAGVEPGAVLLWMPFYLLAHGVVGVLRLGGADLAADGWSEPYRNAIRLGSTVLALIAAALAWDVSRRFVPPLLAAVCVTAFWLGSPLFHYSWAEPAMAHAPAAALVSLLVWLWDRLSRGSAGAGTWVALGLTAGLLVSTQRYDVYFLVLPLFSVGALLRERFRPGARRVALAALAGLVALVPLVFVGLGGPSRFLVNPATAERIFLSDWRHPHVAEQLFASNGGLFAWTPLAIVGVAGLVLLARREPRTGVPLLVTLAIGVWLLASNTVWWGGWSFGARRLTEAFSVLALGLSVGAQALLRRPALLGLALLVPLVGLNMSWSGQVWKGRIRQGDSISFASASRNAVTDLYRSLGHPFSWPAPWLFAWRYGVSPGRFDALFGRVPREEWVVSVGSPEDEAILGRGWSQAVEDEDGTRFRRSAGAVSSLLVTLGPPRPRLLLLRAAAEAIPSRGLATVEVRVNGYVVRRFALSAEESDLALLVPSTLWHPGLNEIEVEPGVESRFRLSGLELRPAATAGARPPERRRKN